MKNNIIYTFILFGLLTFTYFFQELKEREKFELKDKKEILFKAGDFSSFKIGDAHVLKVENEYFLKKSNYLVSEEKVSKVFKILSGIRVDKILPLSSQKVIENKNLFFPKEERKISFLFKKNKFDFYLGNKLEFSQSFYFRVINAGKLTWGIAKDVSDFEGFYRKENYERSPKRYNRLVNLLSLNDEFFRKEKILKNTDIKKVKILSLKNETFTVDLKEKKTYPEKFKGLHYSKAKLNVFPQDLLNLKAKFIEKTYLKSKLEKKLSQIELFASEGAKITLDLFGEYKGRKGFFLTHSGKSTLSHLDQREVTPFFLTVQEFWDLRPKKDLSLKNISVNGTKELKGKNLQKVLSFLLKRPNRVSLLKESSLGKEHLSIKGEKLSFKVFKETQELVFLNTHTGVGYHYWVGNRPKLLTLLGQR